MFRREAKIEIQPIGSINSPSTDFKHQRQSLSEYANDVTDKILAYRKFVLQYLYPLLQYQLDETIHSANIQQKSTLVQIEKIQNELGMTSLTSTIFFIFVELNKMIFRLNYLITSESIEKKNSLTQAWIEKLLSPLFTAELELSAIDNRLKHLDFKDDKEKKNYFSRLRHDVENINFELACKNTLYSKARFFSLEEPKNILNLSVRQDVATKQSQKEKNYESRWSVPFYR